MRARRRTATLTATPMVTVCPCLRCTPCPPPAAHKGIRPRPDDLEEEEGLAEEEDEGVSRVVPALSSAAHH